MEGIKIVGGDDIEAMVPAMSYWLWALTTTFSYATLYDYGRFIQCEKAIQLGLSVDHRESRANNHVCRQISTCIATVIDENEQSLMRAASRIAFACDDSDQTRIMRFRVVTANPVVQIRDVIAAVIRDCGHSVSDTANAIMDGFDQAATVRHGPLHRMKCTGENTKVDDDLLQHLKQITISGCSDGHEVEIQAIQQIVEQKRLPLRYQWRDIVHTSRGSYQACIRWLKPNDTELIDVLIAGPASFAKRVQYSRAFCKKWTETQKEDINRVYEICHNLSYAEVRYCSRSKPMSRFIMLWPSIMQVLVLVSNDTDPAHTQEVKWAKVIIKLTTGQDGFVRMTKFCVECDFFVCCNCMIMLQQGAHSDVAIGQGQIIDCLEQCEAMFQECFIFSVERNHSYTWEWLNGVRDTKTLYFGTEVTTVGWGISQSSLEKPIKFAKELYGMALAFVNVNFPCWNWRAKFACFDNGPSKLGLQTRLDSFEEIVKKEIPSCDSAVAREAFFEAIPMVARLYKQYGDNKRAWTFALEKMRLNITSPFFKPQMREVVSVTLTYLALEDNTNDIERLFRKVNMIESKGRVRHHGLYFLRDSLKIATQCSPDLSLYMFPRGEDDEKKLRDTLMFPNPNMLINLAKRKYVEFYGDKTGRPTEQSQVRKARQELKSANGVPFRCKRKLAPRAHVSQGKRTKLWISSVKEC